MFVAGLLLAFLAAQSDACRCDLVSGVNQKGEKSSGCVIGQAAHVDHICICTEVDSDGKVAKGCDQEHVMCPNYMTNRKKCRNPDTSHESCKLGYEMNPEAKCFGYHVTAPKPTTAPKAPATTKKQNSANRG